MWPISLNKIYCAAYRAAGEIVMKFFKILVICLVLLALLASLASCVPGDGVNHEKRRAGFFTGIWHGWIAPISLIYSIFNRNISIYEIHNNGFWYDLGYYMAVISGFGGLAIFRRRGRSRRRSSD